MEILNLTASALLKAFEKRNLDQTLLLEGTSLTLQELAKTKNKHSWNDFVKMVENSAKYLGRNNMVKEVAHHGIYSENLTLLKTVASNFIDVKSAYWYVVTFVTKHFYKKSVVFKYMTVRSGHIRIEATINENLKDCPLLFEIYEHLFALLPNLLGLPDAKVEAKIRTRHAEYEIFTKQKTFFDKAYALTFGRNQIDTSSVELMTQLENQSEELAKAIDEKSHLLRIVCHDVANHVITIDYYLNKILENSTLSEEEKKYLMITIGSSNKLHNILRNVQNMELTATKGVSLNYVNVEHVFAAVLENFQGQLIQKNISLKIEHHLPQGTFILADALSLETNVFGNLVSNAIKFSNENSCIVLRSKMLNGKIYLTVEDQGVGMPEEIRENLFSCHTHKSSRGTKGEVGSGFGLGIVEKYIKLFNGNISAVSNNDQGTIFIIELDAHQVGP